MNDNDRALKAALNHALRAVIHQRQHAPPQYIHNLDPSAEEEMEVLNDILISSNEPWREDVLSAIDVVYRIQATKKQPTQYSDIPSLVKVERTSISVWKGDVTQLQVGAIVNATHGSGLGCFQPHHRCAANEIHRSAGPRLRMECNQVIMERGTPLLVGAEPIVTGAYHLPSESIVHVAVPNFKGDVTDEQKGQLQRAYASVLETAERNNVTTVAFCAVAADATGNSRAAIASIATRTVVNWLAQSHHNIETIVFCASSDVESATYRNALCHSASMTSASTISPCAMVNDCQEVLGFRQMQLMTAKKWIEEADAILICAGAGMSTLEGYDVYSNKEDFANHYPWMLEYGYSTCYETMGLLGDPRVPLSKKWAHLAMHMENMRWKFPINQGYKALRDLVGDKDYFVLTSNVEAMFERSGFDKERIYTPQGEWTYYQCANACQKDSVFESRPLLDKLLPKIKDGNMPNKCIPTCPRCRGPVFPNVRSSRSFLHERYDEQNEKLRSWMAAQIGEGRRVVAIEVGAGFNTPMVTRMPTESFVAESGGALIRINPTDVEIPRNTKAVGIAEGWQVLEDIAASDGMDCYQNVAMQQQDIMLGDLSPVIAHFGHFDWRRFMADLK
eukprot:CAMPEP_0119549498 /NCGR_PEP_ID=MMETSP1352-20130426/3176_1 /TAXON_ID=265584 /ORGANISM="Stauroneis constricta, Strain CCMP1120" /LENGTH=617 /DNA_ID=CAMNT_0007595061 /DNA_START=220 /DNA_END=2073 /DNA_ORIENTATION=+